MYDMRNNVYIYFFLALFVICPVINLAQTYQEMLEITTDGKDITERLPGLSELQQLAIENSPLLKLYESDEKVGDYIVQFKKRDWLNDIGIEGGARYGLFDNLIITEDMGALGSNTETTEQTRYYIGVYVKVPFSTLMDRSSVLQAKAEKDKIRYQKEVGIQGLKELVIGRYYNVVKEYRRLLIQTNLVENYRVQNLRAETDYNNGQMDVYEYVRLKDMISKASMDLEAAKIDFKNSFQILEQIIGIKIKLKN